VRPGRIMGSISNAFAPKMYVPMILFGINFEALQVNNFIEMSVFSTDNVYEMVLLHTYTIAN
jgi:hypothetical protein